MAASSASSRLLRAAYNYATSLLHLKHFQEAKSPMRRTLPVAKRVLGESSELRAHRDEGLITGWRYMRTTTPRSTISARP